MAVVGSWWCISVTEHKLQDNTRPLLAVCQLDDIEDGRARGFSIGEQNIIVVRQGSSVYAYHNSCPHTGVNLEWLADHFLDDSQQYLQCATQGALFRIEDGVCVAGPCAGESLTAIRVKLDNSTIISD